MLGRGSHLEVITTASADSRFVPHSLRYLALYFVRA